MKTLPIEEIKVGMQILTENKDGFEVHIVEELDEDGFTVIDHHGFNIYPANEDNEPVFLVCEYDHSGGLGKSTKN